MQHKERDSYCLQFCLHDKNRVFDIVFSFVTWNKKAISTERSKIQLCVLKIIDRDNVPPFHTCGAPLTKFLEIYLNCISQKHLAMEYAVRKY